jgi:hypothetical protein
VSTRVRRGFLFLGICLFLSGCRSHFVEVTIVNQGPAVRLVEFDYPSASFGVNQLASGAKYNYRFKIQGNGPLSLAYVDGSGKTHTFPGPTVDQGEEGTLLVNVGSDGAVSWKPSLTKPK